MDHADVHVVALRPRRTPGTGSSTGSDTGIVAPGGARSVDRVVTRRHAAQAWLFSRTRAMTPLLILVLRAYARPNTTPRIKKEKYTLCAEWTMMPIQVLRKRQLGNAYRKTPLMTDARMPQGWWVW